MNYSIKQNSKGNQQVYKDDKEDRALTTIFSLYFFVTLGLGIVGIIKNIPILVIIAVILVLAIFFVPMLLGAYNDYCHSNKTDKRIIRIITIAVSFALIASILLVLN